MPQSIKQWPENLPQDLRLYLSAVSFGMDIMMGRRLDSTINRILMKCLDRKNPPSKVPINGVKTTDITVEKSRKLWFRLYTPTSDRALPVIFFFHGGGFASLAPSSKLYDEFCYQLARKLPAIVISINYRLTPAHRFPTQYEDCFDTIKFIDRTNMEGFSSNANLKLCFIAGDSAGGNIVHHVAVRACEYKFSNIKIIGNISIQPFFGGEERTESELRLNRAPIITTERTDITWKAFLPEGSNRDHPAVNVFGPNAVNIAGVKFPATIVFVGGYDPLIDWQKRYYDGLKKYGKEAYLVEYPNAFHTFFLHPQLAESSLFMKEVKDFMQKQSFSSTTRK